VEATECTSEDVNRLFLSAALHCNIEEVHKQLQRGADPNCKDRDGRPALHIAIYSGDLGIIQGLLELESIDVNCQDIEGCTPLHAAASRDFITSEEVLEILLEKGADVDCRDNNGRTPLHDAAHTGDVHAIDLLLYRGADVNCRDNNRRTPLHDAAHSGDVRAIKMLLEKGADVNCKDNNGCTPLHAAALAGNVFSVIELLLDNGAKMSCKDSNGCTPLHAMTKYLQTSTGNPGKVSTESSVEECLRVIDEVMGALSPGHPAIAMGLKVLEIVKTLPEAHAMGCDFFAGQAGSSGLSGDVSLDQEVECSSMSSTTLSDEESPKAKTRNNTISNAPLTDDLRREISLSSKSCTTFDLSHGDESGSTSENDCEDIDDDANEVEDANEDDEGGNVDNSDYNIEISHNLKGTGTYRYHGGSTSDTKRKGKHIPTKRRRFQSLGDRSNDQEDDESSDQPSKRPKGSKAQGSSPSQSKRPFACPYFKKDPVKYSDCAQWNDTNLRQVKYGF
jgi:ankyrin repeat protein